MGNESFQALWDHNWLFQLPGWEGSTTQIPSSQLQVHILKRIHIYLPPAYRPGTKQSISSCYLITVMSWVPSSPSTPAICPSNAQGQVAPELWTRYPNQDPCPSVECRLSITASQVVLSGRLSASELSPCPSCPLEHLPPVHAPPSTLHQLTSI